ncbi:MAG: CapA family protein [Alphaproteobacteria bacterium]|nr:CapA family protein [Alphaproteobacteria bacterium]
MKMHRFVTVLLALAIAAPWAADARAEQDPLRRSFRMALMGDVLVTRRLSVYREPAYLGLIERIRGADVAIANLETLFHDYESFPMHQSGGTWMRSDPALAQDLVWAGLDMVSRANNHAGDYGVGGMRLTSRYLDRAGIVHAGVGESLGEAREARFLETGKGRVALISIASTFPAHSRASEPRDSIPARPGLNPLRYFVTFGVTREQLASLRTTLAGLGIRAPGNDTQLVFGNRFVVSDKPGRQTRVVRKDVEAMARVVDNARRQADYTVVSVHAHENGGKTSVPAQFHVAFARAMIDAGADVLFAHGPHELRAIEIYKGKPIFYGLGNFVFQNETLLRMPADAYEASGLGRNAGVSDLIERRYDGGRRGHPARPEIWRSVVAVLKWDAGRLARIELHPITLGFGEPRTVRGRPLPADQALGQEIIQTLAELSAPFGTEISMEAGTGVISLPESGR